MLYDDTMVRPVSSPAAGLRAGLLLPGPGSCGLLGLGAWTTASDDPYHGLAALGALHVQRELPRRASSCIRYQRYWVPSSLRLSIYLSGCVWKDGEVSAKNLQAEESSPIAAAFYPQQTALDED